MLGDELPEKLLVGTPELKALSPFELAVFPTDPIKSAFGWECVAVAVVELTSVPGSALAAADEDPPPEFALFQNQTKLCAWDPLAPMANVPFP